MGNENIFKMHLNRCTLSDSSPHFGTYEPGQGVYFNPFFLAGSVLAVTTADPYASDKSKRFVGICIQRGGKGLGATFVLRNVIEDQGGVSAVVIILQVFSKKCVKLQKFSLW